MLWFTTLFPSGLYSTIRCWDLQLYSLLGFTALFVMSFTALFSSGLYSTVRYWALQLYSLLGFKALFPSELYNISRSWFLQLYSQLYFKSLNNVVHYRTIQFSLSSTSLSITFLFSFQHNLFLALSLETTLKTTYICSKLRVYVQATIGHAYWTKTGRCWSKQTRATGRNRERIEVSCWGRMRPEQLVSSLDKANSDADAFGDGFGASTIVAGCCVARFAQCNLCNWTRKIEKIDRGYWRKTDHAKER